MNKKKKKIEKKDFRKSWVFNATQEELDNCICSERDGKGWSTCGFPCSVHNPLAHDKKKLKKYLVEREKKLMKLMAELKKSRIKAKPIKF